MRERRFNSIMPRVHEEFMGQVLGMKRNPGSGIDLLSGTANVEVKFRLEGNNTDYRKVWVVQDHQVDYDKQSKGIPCYWALGFYTLDRQVRHVPSRLRSRKRLEGMVKGRNVYLVPWDWMKQYKPSHTSGESASGPWETVFRYSRFDKLPPVTDVLQIEKGTINLTQGVNPEHFPFLLEFTST